LSPGQGRSFQGISATTWERHNYFLNADLRVAFLLAGVRTIGDELPGIRIANPHNNPESERKRVPVMDWSVVPILTVIVVGFFGFCLMAAAFVMVARQGGWRQAMQSEPDGRWGLSRRLMVAGAFLGVVFGCAVALLFSIPGGIPWNDNPHWSTAVAVFLPTILAVWYFIIRPAHASRGNSTAGHHSEPSNVGSEG
jgi:hypothetical protein